MWQTHTHTHKQDKTTFLPFMPLNKRESPLLLSLIRSPLNIFYDTWHETNALLIIIITDKPFLTINIIMSCVCVCVCINFYPCHARTYMGRNTHTHTNGGTFSRVYVWKIFIVMIRAWATSIPFFKCVLHTYRLNYNVRNDSGPANSLPCTLHRTTGI